MTNFPLRVIGFENKFHAVGCLIKGPHFVPVATSLNLLNLSLDQNLAQKISILSFSWVFPNSSPLPHGLLSQSTPCGRGELLVYCIIYMYILVLWYWYNIYN